MDPVAILKNRSAKSRPPGLGTSIRPIMLKSIGSRITLWYAVTLTLTLACLFVAGDYLLQNYLVHQLDELNEPQFKHLQATLGGHYAKLSPVEIDDRIRLATEPA